MTKHFFETETWKTAKKLVSRQEIAQAFNLENRIALKLVIGGDGSYGDKGNEVKLQYHSESIFDSFKPYDAFVTLEVRRFADNDNIVLWNCGGCGVSSSFGLRDVREMFDNHNVQTVKDGDKCVILVEDKRAGGAEYGYVLTGTLRLPKFRAGETYKGIVEIDKQGN